MLRLCIFMYSNNIVFRLFYEKCLKIPSPHYRNSNWVKILFLIDLRDTWVLYFKKTSNIFWRDNPVKELYICWSGLIFQIFAMFWFCLLQSIVIGKWNILIHILNLRPKIFIENNNSERDVTLNLYFKIESFSFEFHAIEFLSIHFISVNLNKFVAHILKN